jgi:hypothetical protein
VTRVRRFDALLGKVLEKSSTASRLSPTRKFHAVYADCIEQHCVTSGGVGDQVTGALQFFDLLDGLQRESLASSGRRLLAVRLEPTVDPALCRL